MLHVNIGCEYKDVCIGLNAINLPKTLSLDGICSGRNSMFRKSSTVKPRAVVPLLPKEIMYCINTSHLGTKHFHKNAERIQSTNQKLHQSGAVGVQNQHCSYPHRNRKPRILNWSSNILHWHFSSHRKTSEARSSILSLPEWIQVPWNRLIDAVWCKIKLIWTKRCRKFLILFVSKKKSRKFIFFKT